MAGAMTRPKVVSRTLRAAVLAEEPLCRVCGLRSTDLDHIVPQFKGGSSERSNLQALCAPCHQAKSAREQAADPWPPSGRPVRADAELGRRRLWRAAAEALNRAAREAFDQVADAFAAQIHAKPTGGSS